jgi:Coenzyme PQQ synthesis protein D (PqqD)
VQEGHVVVHTTKIAKGHVGGLLQLLHIPSDRFVRLYEHAESIWNKIEQGTTEIATLVQEHSQEHGLALEVAAYEVITFLDELRAQGMISYQLSREREVAPLIDAQTGVADLRAEHLLRLISGQRPFDPPPTQRVVALDADRDDATLADLRAQARRGASNPPVAASPAPTQAGGTPPGRAWAALENPSPKLAIHHLESMVGVDSNAVKHRRVVHLHGSSPDLTVKEIETVTQLGLDQVSPDRRGLVHVIDDVRSDLTIGELEQLSASRVVSDIVIIVTGPIIVIVDGGTTIIDVGGIIIIIISGGGGPTAGKSRSACKTMCV